MNLFYLPNKCIGMAVANKCEWIGKEVFCSLPGIQSTDYIPTSGEAEAKGLDEAGEEQVTHLT